MGHILYLIWMDDMVRPHKDVLDVFYRDYRKINDTTFNYRGDTTIEVLLLNDEI